MSAKRKKKKTIVPKPRIPLPQKPPKVEGDERKEKSRKICRKKILPDATDDVA